MADQPIKLTPIEHRLLYHLMLDAGQVLTRSTLIRRVWGSEDGASPHDLRVFIARLRAKIERPGSPVYIATERDLGYRFEVPPRPHCGGDTFTVRLP